MRKNLTQKLLHHRLEVFKRYLAALVLIDFINNIFPRIFRDTLPDSKNSFDLFCRNKSGVFLAFVIVRYLIKQLEGLFQIFLRHCLLFIHRGQQEFYA